MRLAAVTLLLVACSTVDASTVRVEGYGATRQAAKQDALRNACEQSLRTLVISEREHKNYETIKDEILIACSGYVSDYKVIDAQSYDGQVILTMDVTVSDSKIADRFVVKNYDQSEVQGEVISDSYDSYMEGKLANQNILSNVLDGFSKYAFNIEQGKISFTNDRYNNLVMSIQYKVYWNPNYVRALHESLDANKFANTRHPLTEIAYGALKRRVESVTYRHVSFPDRNLQNAVAKISIDRTTMLFNDYNSNMAIYDMIMAGNKPMIAVELKERMGESYVYSCHMIESSRDGQVLYSLGNRGRDIKIWSRGYINNTIDLRLFGSLKNVEQVTLRIVPQNSCK